MGEWSKRIGEVGEGIVFDLLEIIGWGDAQKNITLPCINGHKHKTSENDRRTHGIDYFFSHPSSLIDGALDHLIISSKYTTSPYPPSPSSDFKKHFNDLAMTLECFKRSTFRKDAGRHFSSVEIARNIGVLFWLTNDKSNQDVISKIALSRNLDGNAYETIFIVDDYRASFLYETITFLKNKYSSDKVEFFHPDTGKNINPATRKTSSKVLPVEYINAPILPFQITTNEGNDLALASLDNFHPDHLQRLIGLAQTNTLGFAYKTLILFPDYDPLLHSNLVNEAKFGFEDKQFTERVSVSSYRSDFRGV